MGLNLIHFLDILESCLDRIYSVVYFMDILEFCI